MADNYEDLVVALRRKIQKLIDRFEATQEASEKQNEVVEALKLELDAKEAEIKALEKKIETYKIAKTVVATSNDAHDAKIKINRIVREIDKCISLMNK